MLSALLTAAQSEGLITVRDVQAMLVDAGCPNHSRGHAHDLMTGAAEPSPAEFAAIVGRLGTDKLAYASARVAGGCYAPVSTTGRDALSSAIESLSDGSALVASIHGAMADGKVTQIEAARLRKEATALRDSAARAVASIDALRVSA